MRKERYGTWNHDVHSLQAGLCKSIHVAQDNAGSNSQGVFTKVSYTAIFLFTWLGTTFPSTRMHNPRTITNKKITRVKKKKLYWQEALLHLTCRKYTVVTDLLLIEIWNMPLLLLPIVVRLFVFSNQLVTRLRNVAITCYLLSCHTLR